MADTHTWQSKAHRIIGDMSRESWRKANILTNGRRRKRHVPYSLPQDARDLVTALGCDDELAAKRIFQRHAFGAYNY